MKKIYSWFIITVMLIAVLIPNAAFATDNAAKGIKVIDVSEYANNEVELSDKIQEAIEKYDRVQIINTDTEAEDNKTDISTPVTFTTSPVYYHIRNVKSLARTYGSDYLNMSGSPDIVIGLADARTKSYSITFKNTFKAPKSTIAEVCWGTTKSRTLTYSGTYKVPKTHNGKKVKKATIHFRPVYSNKQYSVYMTVPGYLQNKYQGKGTTKRAYGVDVYKTFTYK